MAAIMMQQQSDGIIPIGLTELRRYAKQAEEEMSKGKYSNEFTSTRHYTKLGAFSHYYYCSVFTELFGT